MISTPLPRCPGGRRRGRSDSQYGALSAANWMEVSPRDISAYSLPSRASTRKPRTFSNQRMDCSKSLTQISVQLVLIMECTLPLPVHSSCHSAFPLGPLVPMTKGVIPNTFQDKRSEMGNKLYF